MTREEITKYVKQVIKMEMLKKDMNFVELQKVMEEHGVGYYFQRQWYIKMKYISYKINYAII